VGLYISTSTSGGWDALTDWGGRGKEGKLVMLLALAGGEWGRGTSKRGEKGGVLVSRHRGTMTPLKRGRRN